MYVVSFYRILRLSLSSYETLVHVAVAGVRREMASKWRNVYESIVHQEVYARDHNSAAEQNTGGGVEIALPGFFGDPSTSAVRLYSDSILYPYCTISKRARPERAPFLQK